MGLWVDPFPVLRHAKKEGPEIGPQFWQRPVSTHCGWTRFVVYVWARFWHPLFFSVSTSRPGIIKKHETNVTKQNNTETMHSMQHSHDKMMQ